MIKFLLVITLLLLPFYNTHALRLDSTGSVVGGTAQGLDANYDIEDTIDGANSAANAVKIGADGTGRYLCIYDDATTGRQFLPCDSNGNTVAVDRDITIFTNQEVCFVDEENSNADVMCFDPDHTGAGDGEVTINNLDLVVAGPITGEIAVDLRTVASVDLSADATGCRGQWYINNDADAIDFTLCPAAAGLSACFRDNAGGVITVDTADTGDTIKLDGTALTAGNAIDSPGNDGDQICLLALDASTWINVSTLGTWVDGGAD